MKVVINVCFGGFGLSHKAVLLYLKLKGKQVWVIDPTEKFGFRKYSLVPPEHRMQEMVPKQWRAMSLDKRALWNKQYTEQTFSEYDLQNDEHRGDPLLVQVVEQLGKAANGQQADLKIVEVPDDVQWHIHEYDGTEHVAENHRRWS